MIFSQDIFLKSGHKINYTKNEYILKQGEVSNKAFFLIKGVVRHYLLDVFGNEKTIRISKENNFFYSSNVSFYNGNPSYINCQALTNVNLLYWSKDELNKLSIEDSGFIDFENKKLKDFILEKHKKEISRITKNAEERLNEFNQYNIELFNRIPHHIIASYLDMTPETLSRLRAKFKK